MSAARSTSLRGAGGDAAISSYRNARPIAGDCRVATLLAMTNMIIAVIPVDSLPNTIPRIQAALPQVDGIELRLDFARHGRLEIDEVSALRQMLSLPVIFTLRKSSEGGHWQKSEAERLKTLQQLAILEPDYMDIEHDVPHAFVTDLKKNHPGIQLICSRHFFRHTPDNLPFELSQLQHPCFDLYKMAAFASCTDDALRMLAFVATHSRQYPLTGICMGEHGRLTRLLSKLAGNVMHYAPLDNNYAISPGQVLLSQALIYLKG